jgi:hypothetical protein
MFMSVARPKTSNYISAAEIIDFSAASGDGKTFKATN